MAFNINSFITNMKRDGYRPNLFEILMTLPGGGATTAATTQFTFKARASSIPGSSVGVAPSFYFGRQAKFAGNRSFDNWQVTVIMDETDFQVNGVRGMFERWSGLLNSHVGNVRTPSYVTPSNEGYFGRAEIVPYSKDGSQLKASYYMEGCFPVDIGAMPLDWSDNDRIAEFPVTFAFQWWTSTSSV